MSTVPYHSLLAAVALRVNALGNDDLWNATDAAGLQTVYEQRPLIDEMFGSSIFPMNAIRDAILNAEQRLAIAIGDTGNHPWRPYLGGPSETAALASGADMPTVDAAGKSIVGIYGNVTDATSGVICTEPEVQPLETIRRYLLLPSLWLMPLYAYTVDGNGIYHTRTGVKVQVCVYDYATQQAAFDRNDNMLLPDVLAPALIAGGTAALVRDDEFVQQATLYAQYFNATELSIRQGLTSVSQMSAPGLAVPAA